MSFQGSPVKRRRALEIHTDTYTPREKGVSVSEHEKAHMASVSYIAVLPTRVRASNHKLLHGLLITLLRRITDVLIEARVFVWG